MIQPLKNAPSVWTLCWVDIAEPLPVEDDFFLPVILILVGPEFEPLAPPEMVAELDQVGAEEWVARIFDDLGAPDQLLVWKAEEWVPEDWKFFARDWKLKLKLVPPPPHEARLLSQFNAAGSASPGTAPRASKAAMSAGLARNVPHLRSPRKRRATLDKAAELDPANADALAELADLEFHAGRHERSVEFASRALDAGAALFDKPDVRWWDDPRTRPLLRALNATMLSRWHQGRIQDAAEEGRRLLALDQADHMGARFYMPLFLLLAGEHEEAASFFRYYARTYPGDMPNAWLGFAWGLCLSLEGDDQGARKKYREAMLANIYIAPRLLGERPPPDNIFHPTERDDAQSALEFAGSFGGLWEQEAAALRALRDAHEEMRPVIAELVGRRAEMAALLDHRYDPDYRAKWARLVDADEEFVKKAAEGGED